MKKIFNKLLTGVLAGVCAFGAFGCSKLPDDVLGIQEEIDPNKTQLYLGLFNGALGREFMDKIIDEYEAANPDIQVVVTFLKNEFEDGTLLVQMPNSGVDIYYLDTNTYSSFVDKNLLEDITTTVTDKIYDNNGDLTNGTATKSILDTMKPEWRNLFKTEDNKYYAIPNWMSTPGIIYDADLFEENGYEVPETYPDFVSLMDTMYSDGYTPFIFAGMDYIVLNSMYYFYADYEGKNDFFLNSTFKGTDSTLGEINYENAWKLQTQEGKKASLQFAKDLASNSTYVTSSTRSGGLSHIDAQGEFVRSINTVESGKRRVAMLLENSYWEREAKGTFDSMTMFDTEDQKYGFGERNFKYMLAPKFIGVDGIDDTQNTSMHTVYGATSNSFCCINKASSNKDLAKDFMQFAQSRRALALYTMYSGCLRAYDFTMTAAEYDLCTPFTQSLIDLTRRDDVEFVPMSKQNPITKMENTDFDYDWMFRTNAKSSDVAGGQYAVQGRSVYNLFYNNARLTVDEYYDGMETYWKNKWVALYEKLDSKYKN